MEEKETKAIKIIKSGVIIAVAYAILFLFFQFAESWGLTHQQKIVFYGFFTILGWTSGCYAIYYIVGRIYGKKVSGIFLSVIYGIIMLFIIYWIIRAIRLSRY